MIENVVYEDTSKPVYRIKIVEYKCGCTVRLGGWDESFAPMSCREHGERIIEIITKILEA